MSEIIAVVNEQDEVIGSVGKDKFDKNTGQIYRTVGLFLINKDGKILIQQRSLSKKTYAGEWDITGVAGHVDFGENYVEAVIREAEEEVGLKLENVTFLSKTFGEYPGNRRRFTAIFMAMVDFEVEDLTVSKDEVEQVRLVSFVELGRMIKSSEMNFTKYSLSNLAENQEKIVHTLRSQL